MSVLDGETVTALPIAPIRAGFVFGGWFTAVSGGGTEFTTSTVVTADITVYAKWITVYVAGTEDYGTEDVAKYWKNGVATSLSDGTQDANVNAMQIIGSDVYVAGNESNGTEAVAKYWQNYAVILRVEITLIGFYPLRMS